MINRYLRDVTYPKFCRKQGQTEPAKSYYKEVYRPSKQFMSDYISLCEDIKTYEDFYTLFPDGLSTDIKQKDILTSPPQSLDFNDNYYYKMALKNNFTIYTQIAQEAYKPKPKHKKEKFLDSLPAQFNRQAYVAIALILGITDKSAQRYIKEFVDADILQNGGRDKYSNPNATNPQ